MLTSLLSSKFPSFQKCVGEQACYQSSDDGQNIGFSITGDGSVADGNSVGPNPFTLKTLPSFWPLFKNVLIISLLYYVVHWRS